MGMPLAHTECVQAKRERSAVLRLCERGVAVLVFLAALPLHAEPPVPTVNMSCTPPAVTDPREPLFVAVDDARDRSTLVDCSIPSADARSNHGALLTERDCFIRGGVFMRDNPAFAISVWAPDARAGNAAAMYELAGIYDRGLQRTLSAYWYEEAARRGHREAAARLALKYRTGDGVPLDWGLAIQWAQVARNKGTADLRSSDAVHMLSELSQRLRDAERRVTPKLDIERR